MLTTSFVVATAVGASAWFGQRAIHALAREDAAVRQVRGEATIVRESELLARNLAAASAMAMAQQAYGEVGPLLASAVRESPRIQWVAVATESGQLVAATEGAPAGGFDEFPATRLAPGSPEHRVVEHRRVAPGQPDWIYATAIRVGDQLVGQVRMGVSSADLDRELAGVLADADRRARESGRSVWLVAAGVLGFGLLLAAIQGVTTARPLKALATVAQQIAGGRLDQRVPEDRRDEIGVLAHEFNHMAQQLGALMIAQAEKASMQRELELARAVQQGMLPPPALVQHGPFKLVGYCETATACGGDWWTYRALTGGRLLLVIGDATGHGVHSAILASTARGAVEAVAEADERLLTPEQVLRSIHAAICNVGEHSLLMTAFAALIDPATGLVQYANAGQNFPYVLRMKPNRTLGDATIVAASGNPLGDRQVAVQLRRGSVQLQPGDLFVAFTDGVVERQAPSGKLFGDRRLRTVFAGRELLAQPDALPRLREDLRAAIERFGEGTVVQDDITFVLCQYDPAAADAQPRRIAQGDGRR